MRKDTKGLPSPITEDPDTKALTNAKAIFWDNYVPSIIEDDYKQLSSKASFKDTTNKVYTLTDIIGKRYKLVVRYSFIDCDLCVNAIMKEVKIAGDQQSIKDVIAITTSASDRDFLIRSRENQRPIKVYNVTDGSAGLIMENKNFPFMFVLTPDGRAIKIFPPMKENVGQIKAYLTKVLDFVNTCNKNAGV